VTRYYYCCGQLLQRARTSVAYPVVSLSEAARETGRACASLVQAADGERRACFYQCSHDGIGAVEVIPPTGNTVDALAMEGLLGSLGVQAPFSLEIAADDSGRCFILRARDGVLGHLCSQMETVYEQVEFRPLTEEDDPARRLRVEGVIEQYERDEQRRVAMGKLHLRRFEALPLRTYRDGEFRDADPILAVLGGFGRLAEGEQLLSQLLVQPAPDDWADGFQSLTRPPDMRIKTESPLGFGGGLLLAGSIGVGLAAFLRLLTWMVAGKWLAAGLLGLGLLPPGYVAYRAYRAFGRDRLHAEPGQVARKIYLPGYRFQLRLAVSAPTHVQARRRLQQLAAAYRHFNAGAGNALVLEETVFDPYDLDTGWNDRARLPGRRRDIINVAEAASLWHLPWGDEAQLVSRTLTASFLPLPDEVAEGVLVGTSTHQGRTVSVHLPWSAVERNKLFVARTRKGKTTLMLILAQADCRLSSPVPTSRAMIGRSGQKAVVFIDPHGDAAKHFVGTLPRHRVGDTVYLDFSDRTRVPAWNLLDTRMGFSPELITQSILRASKRIWHEFWGPRMQDVFEHVVRSLVHANRKRDRHEQYTILDVQAALILDDFQLTIREQVTDDPELMIWWYGYFDKLPFNFRVQIINPVLTKIQDFCADPTIRRIVSQPASTVDVLKLLSQGGILAVNLPGGTIGMETAAFLGSLLLSYLEAVIKKNEELPPGRRPRLSCYIDECAEIPFTYQKLLAALVKLGASFNLTTQSLAQLEAIEPGLPDATLANIDTLAVFQTSGRDARQLVWELADERVEPNHIVNLPERTCYLKTQRDGKPLQVMTVDLLDMPEADEETARLVQQGRQRYTIGAMEAEQRYRRRVQQMYAMDLEAFQRKLSHWQEVARRAREEKERREQEAAWRGAPETAVVVTPPQEPEGASQLSFFGAGAPVHTPLPEDLEKQSELPATKRHTRTRKGGD
jgi:hypothetical protein